MSGDIRGRLPHGYPCGATRVAPALRGRVLARQATVASVFPGLWIARASHRTGRAALLGRGRKPVDLTVIGEGWRVPATGSGHITAADLAAWLRTGEILRHVQRYRHVDLLVPRTDFIRRPLAMALAIRFLARRSARFVDASGRHTTVDVRLVLGLASRLGRDTLGYLPYSRGLSRRAQSLKGERDPSIPVEFSGDDPILYLTAGFTNGAPSGGEVSHTAGVLNSLGAYGRPVWITTQDFDAVDAEVERHVVQPSGRFLDYGGLALFALGDDVLRSAVGVTKGRPPAFVYQRASAGVTAGAELARCFGVPLVLEVNSLAATYARLWGRPLSHGHLVTRFESLTLRNADVVVAVSEPLRDELVDIGVSSERILVNPNGVDPTRYSPELDGSAVRARYDLTKAVVLGFVGTFRPYHGATVLAEAFGRLVASLGPGVPRVHLLMIGGGPELEKARGIVEASGVGDLTTFTGPVEQTEGPGYMAACDVLVSPHVPNADGTPFFGSPTKLFEYMAMGKAIVASDLDQIGQVLKHGETALLVRPGDPAELATALRHAVEQPGLRARLGQAAREVVLATHTWEAHTNQIITRLSDGAR